MPSSNWIHPYWLPMVCPNCCKTTDHKISPLFMANEGYKQCAVCGLRRKMSEREYRKFVESLKKKSISIND